MKSYWCFFWIYFVAVVIMNGCGHREDSDSWTASERDGTLAGCLPSAAQNRPDWTASQVGSYCQCWLEGAMKVGTPYEWDMRGTELMAKMESAGTINACRENAR